MDAAFFLFLKILVSRVYRDCFESIKNGDRLLAAKGDAVSCPAVYRAPDGFEHIRFYDRGILMERKWHAKFQCLSGRTDAGGSFKAEVADVGISPVVSVRHKERGDKAKRGCSFKLVFSNQLCVDDDRAYGSNVIAFLFQSLKSIQILLAGGVAVAVSQNLHVFFHRFLAESINFLVA